MTAFQLFEKNLALVSYYIAKQEDFPKIVQLNRKCVSSFDADCSNVRTERNVLSVINIVVKRWPSIKPLDLCRVRCSTGLTELFLDSQKGLLGNKKFIG